MGATETKAASAPAQAKAAAAGRRAEAARARAEQAQQKQQRRQAGRQAGSSRQASSSSKSISGKAHDLFRLLRYSTSNDNRTLEPSANCNLLATSRGRDVRCGMITTLAAATHLTVWCTEGAFAVNTSTSKTDSGHVGDQQFLLRSKHQGPSVSNLRNGGVGETFRFCHCWASFKSAPALLVGHRDNENDPRVRTSPGLSILTISDTAIHALLATHWRLRMGQASSCLTRHVYLTAASVSFPMKMHLSSPASNILLTTMEADPAYVKVIAALFDLAWMWKSQIGMVPRTNFVATTRNLLETMSTGKIM
jgi:hypothetical protein